MFRQMPKLPLFKEYKGLFTLAVQTSGRRHRRKIKENLLYSCVFVSTFALLVYECRLIPSRFLAAEERRRRGFWEGDEGRAKGYGKDESGINVCSYKSVALSHKSCDKLDKIRRVIVPDAEVSRAKALDILINEKARKLNGRLGSKGN